MVEWCADHGCNYAQTARWIAADTERQERFNTALLIQADYLTEIVKRNLRMMAEADISMAYDDDCRLIPLRQMPEAIRRSISGVESLTVAGEGGESERVTKIKIVDPARATEMLGKYLKMFVDRREITGADGGAIQVQIAAAAALLDARIEQMRIRDQIEGAHVEPAIAVTPEAL